MKPRSHDFKRNARRALADEQLQQSLKVIDRGFVQKRARARDRLAEFDSLCRQAMAIRTHTRTHLDLYLEEYEKQLADSGGHLHMAATASEARLAVLEICRNARARTITKGKSMVSEEIGLNAFLDENGLRVVETDLGEYIIQLRGEPPSHVVAPAVHVSAREVEEVFRREHRQLPAGRDLPDPQALVCEARSVLRTAFLNADVGITGANFLIASTGSSVIVTNEGNGDLTQSLPAIHIVIASIDKLVPTIADANVLLRVLARSATGQPVTSYTTFATGPRRDGDEDGPAEYHVILLDNGRISMLEGEFASALDCIRCGACMNHCPVYQSVGGHAYGWVYPGPIGSVLSPAFLGLEKAADLPHACTSCGRCRQVCPVGIDLPDLLRKWRQKQYAARGQSVSVRLALSLWTMLARFPRLYQLSTGTLMPLLRLLAGNRRKLGSLPLLKGWTDSRDLPAPSGRTFMELLQEHDKKERKRHNRQARRSGQHNH